MRVDFEKEKIVQRQNGTVKFASGEQPVSGYEIHHGRVTGIHHPLLQTETGVEGYFHQRLLGTHVHGFFQNATCRTAFLAPIRKQKNLPLPVMENTIAPIDRWAKHVKDHVNWQKIIDLMEAVE